MKKHKVLIVGCGELGSRHLQAIASLSEIAEIHIVDCRPEGIELGKNRLREVKDINQDIQFKWFLNLDPQSAEGDLCIVATQAQGRCGLVKEISEKLGYKTFLLEKLVSQSVQEYEDLLLFSKKHNIAAWVNCKLRTYSIHKYIKQSLSSREPIIFNRVAGNHGLASNGIHAVDLFLFYDDSKSIAIVNSRIDPKLHISKRSGKVYDLSGTLHGVTEKGSDFIISFAANHTGPDFISVVGSRCRFIVDQFQKIAYESFSHSGWKWNTINIEENWLVSYMTKKFVSDILLKNNCELPTLAESFPAHQFILDSLISCFNRLLNKETCFCPVT